MSVRSEAVGIRARSGYMRRQRVGYLYILPWILGFLIFQFYPFAVSIYYSFTNYSVSSSPTFLGFDNYITMFTTDPDMMNSLIVTFKYVFMSVPLKIIFALIIALILNMSIRGMNAFRTVYYLPSILGGSVAVSILWRNLFETDGIINKLLEGLGIGRVQWLTSPKIALLTLSLLSVWQFGSSMVFFLAGLKQIPAELYEVAEMDGAGKLRRFFTITLPLLTPIVFFNLVMQMINAFQEFTASFIVTSGGPLKSTYLYGMLLYHNGFMYMKMGYASAMSWVLFIIILAFTMLVFRSSAYWTFYSDGGKS